MFEETVIDKVYETLLVFYCCVTNHHKTIPIYDFTVSRVRYSWLCTLVRSGSHQAAIKMSAATGVSYDTQSPFSNSLVVGRIQFLTALGLRSLHCCWLAFSDPRDRPPFLATWPSSQHGSLLFSWQGNFFYFECLLSQGAPSLLWAHLVRSGLLRIIFLLINSMSIYLGP